MFDWRQFLERSNIEYELEGNQARTRCPFCPPNTRHMSINLNGEGWKCWVGHKHSGINPTRLIASFLDCSFEQARAVAGIDGPQPVDDFASRMDALRRSAPTVPYKPELKFPSEFRPLDNMASRPFIRYMKSPERGSFTNAQIMHMNRRYGLQCCMFGEWRYRIIFPIYLDKRLVAWTGRTISVQEKLRYKSEGQAPHHLLWFDQLLQGGQSIVLVEGPFDALKLRVLGQPATCFFTSGPSSQQIELLHELLPRYRKQFLLLDQGTHSTAMRIQSQLSSQGVEIRHLPAGIKDPALLNDLDCLRAEV